MNGHELPRRRKLLAILLAASLLVRLAWCLSRPVNAASIDALPDQRGYLELAQNLLKGNGLKSFDPRFEQDVHAVRTPGYPLLLAACGAAPRVVRAVQAVLDSSTVLAIYWLTRRLRRRDDGPVAAFSAAMLVAFNPFLIYFCGLLLTETLFTAMLAWGMLLLTFRRRFILGIALLGLSVIVRPSAMALPILLSFIGIWATWEHDAGPAGRAARVGNALGAAMIAMLLVVALLLPWAWRNQEVLGEWVWTTTNDGITAYDGFNPAATGASDQRFVQEMPELQAMSETQRSQYLSVEARRFIRDNPARLLPLIARKLARTWSPFPLSEEYGKRSYVMIGLLFSVPFDLLVLIGVVRGGLPRQVVLWLALPAIYFTVVHALSVGSLRYRVPAEPPLAVLAGAGAAFVSRVRGRRAANAATETAAEV